MPSERIQRQIDRLLDEAEDAAGRKDWATAYDRAEHALTLDPENADAVALRAAAGRGLAAGQSPAAPSPAAVPPSPPAPEPAHPTSFVGGRYAVTRFLGEGGKKRVYLTHESLLDRDVAFALIKIEGARRRRPRPLPAGGPGHGPPGRPSPHRHHLRGGRGGRCALPFHRTDGGGDIETKLVGSGDHRLSIEEAQRLTGDPAQAEVCYRQALEVCGKVRFRPEIALTRLQLAELLLDHHPDRAAEAQAHLDFAMAEFRAMKMAPGLERALRRKGMVGA